MNEENSSAVLPDQGDVLAAEDPAAALDPVTETVEIVAEEVRPFLTTDFNDYTVTEGLLLVIALLIVGKICIDFVRRGFYWL